MDKMSRRDEVRQDKKFTFGHNVQTERDEIVNDMKTEMLRVRMTPEEKAALHKQASLHRKSMSEYIRSVAKCPPDVTRDEFDASIVRMIYEINKIELISIRLRKNITNINTWNPVQICWIS